MRIDGKTGAKLLLVDFGTRALIVAGVGMLYYYSPIQQEIISNYCQEDNYYTAINNTEPHRRPSKEMNISLGTPSGDSTIAITI